MEELRDIDDVRYLALSVSDAADDVIALVRAGARGYVTKSITADELCDAVDLTSPPATPSSPGTGRLRARRVQRRRRAPIPSSTSSRPRAYEVLRLLARGNCAYKEIARS